jgi:hypothetical protein
MGWRPVCRILRVRPDWGVVSEPRRQVSDDLTQLAEELGRRGLGEQVDFSITGRFPDVWPSSEHIGITELGDGTYRVWYKDMGVRRELLETADFIAAREVFVRETEALASGRGWHERRWRPWRRRRAQRRRS